MGYKDAAPGVAIDASRELIDDELPDAWARWRRRSRRGLRGLLVRRLSIHVLEGRADHASPQAVQQRGLHFKLRRRLRLALRPLVIFATALVVALALVLRYCGGCNR